MPRRAPPSSSRRRHPFFWVAAAAVPLCVAIYVSAAIAIWRYGPYVQQFGWTAVATRNGVVVASVDAGGPADGKLHPGDAIASVSAGVVPPVGIYRRAAPMDRPYTIHVASSRPIAVELTAPVTRTGPLGRLLATYLSALAFVGVGLFLGLVRPDVPVGRLVFLGFLGTSKDAISGCTSGGNSPMGRRRPARSNRSPRLNRCAGTAAAPALFVMLPTPNGGGGASTQGVRFPLGTLPLLRLAGSILEATSAPVGHRTRAVIHPEGLMDRDFTLRKVWCDTDPVWFISRVHAPHGDAIGCVVEIDSSGDVERARRDGMPVPFWNEFVVIEPFQDAAPDVLCVEHRDLKSYLDRVLELLKSKR